MKLQWSIRMQLYALVLAIALPLIGLLAYVIYADVQHDVREARASTLNLAQLVAANTRQFLADMERVLTSLARRHQGPTVDLAGCGRLLNGFPDLYPYFVNIEVADLSGQVICATRPSPAGAPASAAPAQWFQSVKQSETFVVGAPFLDPVTGKWVSPLAYPLRDEGGTLVGVAGLMIDLARYQLILGDVSLLPGATITMVDGEGTVVARSLEPENWVGQNARGTEIVDIALAQGEGQAQAHGFDGVDRIWGFTTVPGANWRVYTGIPVEVVYAPIRAEVVATGLLVLASMLGVVVLVRLLGARITRPIRALAGAAHAVGQGHMETRAPVTGPREVAEVAAQFNEMLTLCAQAEEALQARERHFRALIENSSDITVLLDAQGAVRYSSPAITRVLGHAFDERAGRSGLELVHPDDLPQARDLFAQLMQTPGGSVLLQERLRHKDGSWRWVEGHATNLLADPAVQAIVVNARDITGRKRAEEALRESEARYRAIVEDQTELIARWLPDGTVTFVNDAVCRYMGQPREELLGRPFMPMIPEADRPAVQALINSLGPANPAGTIEHRVRLPGGEIRWREWADRAIFNPEGRVIEFQSVGRDITERKQAEDALRESEQRFRSLLESAADAIVAVNREGRITFVNAQTERAFGYSREELLGQTVELLINERLRSGHAQQRDGYFADPKIRPMGGGLMLSARRKDESEFPAEISLSPLNTSEGQWVITIIRDLTERQRVEQEARLLQTAALAASEAEDLSAALQITLRTVCEATGWVMGEAWLPRADGAVLECSPVWYTRAAGLEKFRAASEGMTFSPGEGLPGRAWASRKPVWVQDVTLKGGFLRVSAAREAGFRAAMGIPVVARGEVVAVLVFFVFEPREEDGRLLGVVSAVAVQLGAVIQRKQAEGALQGREKHFRALIENSSDLIVLIDAKGTIRYASPAVTRVLGYALDESMGRNAFELLHLDDHPHNFSLFAELLQTPGGSAAAQIRVQHKDGSWRWIEAVGGNLLAEPAVQAIVVNARDITERKQAEETLRVLSSAVEQTADMVVITDRDGVIKYVNPAFEAFTGYTRDEAMGQTPRILKSGVHDEAFYKTLWSAILAGQTYQGTVVNRKKNGELYYEAKAIAPVRDAQGNILHFVATGKDVTDQKRAEEALRASEARYRAIVQDQTELICRIQPDGAITFVNDAYCRYFGQPAERLLGSQFKPTMHPDDVDVVSRKRGALGPQLATVTYWHRVVLPGGAIRWQQWTDRALFDEGGRLVEIQSVGQDITERKEAEEALKQRNEELLALNAIATAIGQAPDLNRLVNDVLAQLLELLEMDGGCVYLLEESGAGRSLVLAAQRGFAADFEERLNIIRPDEHGDAGLAAELPAVVAHVLKANGWSEGPGCESVPIQSKEKALGVLGVFRRGPNALSHHERQTLLTIGRQAGVAIENMRLDEQAAEVEILRELDRLRSELIANVSHELRTPLGLIMLFCTTLLREEVSLDRETQREFLQDIKEEADRLERIVDNLLDVSRLQSGRLRLDLRPMDIRKFVRETLDAMEPQLARHHLVYDFPPEPLVAVVDAKRLEQVLRNLVGNAVKYSPVGGDITIRGRSAGKELLIEFSDRGFGIPAQDLPRVFERFYRVPNEITQQVKGVGLGLAVCRGIVEAHGGRIWAESTVGEGSTFYFTLPTGPQMEGEGEGG